jgi:hypothetical protein
VLSFNDARIPLYEDCYSNPEVIYKAVGDELELVPVADKRVHHCFQLTPVAAGWPVILPWSY